MSTRVAPSDDQAVDLRRLITVGKDDVRWSRFLPTFEDATGPPTPR